MIFFFLALFLINRFESYQTFEVVKIDKFRPVYINIFKYIKGMSKTYKDISNKKIYLLHLLTVLRNSALF